jgi:formylglycine-generating enzyme
MRESRDVAMTVLSRALPRVCSPLRFLSRFAGTLGVGAACALLVSRSSAETPRSSTSLVWAGRAVCPRGMVALPGGTFKKPYPIPDVPDETVTVHPFCMDLTEVTVDAYAVCVRNGSCTADHPGARTEDGIIFSPDEHCNFGVAGKGNHPMNCVDWDQSVSYCKSVNKRLPTERQWEWAARGGPAGRLYPWGNAAPALQLCGGVKSGGLGTCPVGSTPSGDAIGGIHDLAGNVEEWTSTTLADMMPPNSLGSCGGPTDCRVTCGGSWNDLDAASFRTGFSGDQLPQYRNFFLGFRCVQ